MKNNGSLYEMEDAAVAAAGELAQSLSLNRVAGQLYALLYLRPEPVSLDEMCRRLKISKGSASVNIRILEEWNAVRRVWVQGSRKDFYAAEADFMKVALDRLEKGLSRRTAFAKEKLEGLEAGIERLEGMDVRSAAFFRDRIKRLRDTVSTVEKLAPLLSKIRGSGGLSLLKVLVK